MGRGRGEEGLHAKRKEFFVQCTAAAAAVRRVEGLRGVRMRLLPVARGDPSSPLRQGGHEIFVQQ